MQTGKKQLILSLGVFILFTVLFSQSSGYLSQKLMVENNIRDRVKDALSKIIDSHKYVINVDVELEVLDEVNEQITVFSPREEKLEEKETPAQKTATVLQRMQENIMQEEKIENESYSIGLPIPGFEVDVSQQKSEQRSITQSNPISPKTMEPIQNSISEENKENRELVDKVVSRKRPSRAQVKRMDIALILQEGAAPELIENIRQLTMASSKFNRNRGDKITIMTASFKERRDQKSAEQIMLKNIAEKIENLEQKRIVESGSWREDIERYKTEQSLRREQDLASLQDQMAELEKKRVEEAAEYEKKELMRRDSIKNSKLEKEIEALKDMLTMKNNDKSQLDSNRFAMLDNELQSLNKRLIQAMMNKDSADAAEKTAQIESELAMREREKKTQDSLIQEKLLALDAAQAELSEFQAEAKTESDSSKLILHILSGISALLLVTLIFVLLRNKKNTQSNIITPPMPPWMMYPPQRPPRRKKRKRRPAPKKESAPVNKVEEEKEVVQSAVSNGDVQNQSSESVDTKPHKLSDDPNVLKSEIDDIRKSVVSMSVGQPSKTSTIVQEWLEQPAPAPAAETEDSAGEEEGSNEQESDEE